jgi:hypothetical protein
MLSKFGMEAFAKRAARELRGTGATARKRSVQTSSKLTPQKAQIARLAGEGLSNPQIAADSPQLPHRRIPRSVTGDLADSGSATGESPDDGATPVAWPA